MPWAPAGQFSYMLYAIAFLHCHDADAGSVRACASCEPAVLHTRTCLDAAARLKCLHCVIKRRLLVWWQPARPAAFDALQSVKDCCLCCLRVDAAAAAGCHDADATVPPGASGQSVAVCGCVMLPLYECSERCTPASQARRVMQ